MQAARLATVVPLHRRAATYPDIESATLASLIERKAVMATALDRLCAAAGDLSRAASLIVDALRAGGRVLIAGNGGSAAEAQHFATELVGRFKREREAYAAIALTADTAILTAIGNDYGYEEVFARQVAAYGRPGDVLVAFSTSGESENLIRAARVAAEREIAVVAVTGERASRLAAMADLAIQVPAMETPLAQELHTVVLHVVCDAVESSLTSVE
jgi:D-sedoheptulose 7-phosphate isomerase